MQLGDPRRGAHAWTSGTSFGAEVSPCSAGIELSFDVERLYPSGGVVVVVVTLVVVVVGHIIVMPLPD